MTGTVIGNHRQSHPAVSAERPCTLSLVLFAVCRKRLILHRFRSLLIISHLSKCRAVIHPSKHAKMGVLYYNPGTLLAGSPDPLRPSGEVFSL